MMRAPAAVLLFATIAVTTHAQPRRRPSSFPAPERPMSYRGDAARSGFVDVAPLRTAPQKAWSRRIAFPMAVVLARGVVFVNSDGGRPGTRGTLFALDAESGDTLWSLTHDGRTATQVAVTGDTIWFADQSRLRAVELRSGVELWSLPIAGMQWQSSPAIDGREIFLATTSFVYSVDRATGALNWSTPITTDVAFDCAVDAQSIYVATRRDLIAFDRHTGAERWRRPSPGGRWLQPALAGPRLFSGILGGPLIALDTTTGEIAWRLDAPGSEGDWSAPAVRDGVVFAAKNGDALYAVDANDGSVRWRNESRVRCEAPTLVRDVVHCGVTAHSEFLSHTIRGIQALDSVTGTELWRLSGDSMLFFGELADAEQSFAAAFVIGDEVALYR